jgi:hypothetical protein
MTKKQTSTALDLDLEEYRLAEGLTYEQFRQFLDLSDKSACRDYCLGILWPGTFRLRDILRRMGGKVTLDAMFRRREAYLVANGKLAPSAECLEAHEAPHSEIGSTR